MSEIQMSKRPEWMPEVMGLLVKDFYRTGLRAQIEALEELAKENSVDNEWHSRHTMASIAFKIAALRKELEG